MIISEDNSLICGNKGIFNNFIFHVRNYRTIDFKFSMTSGGNLLHRISVNKLIKYTLTI